MIRLKYLAVLAFFLTAVGCASAKKPESAPAPAPAATPVPAAEAKPKAPVVESNRLELVCEQGTDKRSVTVVPKNPGCELHYRKFGNSEVIATSGVRVEFCDEIQARVRKNLEAGQFSCR